MLSELTGSNQSMAAQQALYERIQAFSLDQPNAQLSFSKRLARDNGWSLEYAQHVIEEYKKFAFLAVVAGHPVTPSDQVDQVWHLHLTYTRSYWEDFCSQVLQTPLHHDPTRGGQAESQKFDDWYSKTLESYERFFGQRPPAEIWFTPEDRFGRDLHFVRVNTQQNWVLPKVQIRGGVTASVAIALALVLGGCYAGSPKSSSNPIAAILVVAAGFGFVWFLMAVIDFIRNPTAPRTGGDSGGSGCGSGGCGGWGWGDSGSHGDGGDGGDGGGDGGSGCGGGGCGGGGCGGCGG